MRKASAALIALSIALPCCTPAPAPPATTPATENLREASGALYFSRRNESESRSDVFRLDVATGTLHRETHTRDALFPDHDGRTLLYNRWLDDPWSPHAIYTRSGTHQPQLLGPYPGSLIVPTEVGGSPILAMQTREGRGRVPETSIVSILPGESPKPLIENADFNMGPAWSPAGDGFVWARRDGRVAHLWIADARGRHPVQLTNGDHFDSQPAWAPDGQLIAFATTRGPDSDEVQACLMRGYPACGTALYAVDIAGGEPRLLYESEKSIDRPTWSPDGAWIAFVEENGEDHKILALRLADKKLIELTEGPNDDHPDWSTR